MVTDADPDAWRVLSITNLGTALADALTQDINRPVLFVPPSLCVQACQLLHTLITLDPFAGTFVCPLGLTVDKAIKSDTGWYVAAAPDKPATAALPDLSGQLGSTTFGWSSTPPTAQRRMS